MPAAVATLLAAGLQAMTNSFTSGLPITISKWELGGAAAEAVPPSTTSALPAVIYTGSASRVVLVEENGIAVFNIILDESVGDFFVGNVALKIIDPVDELEKLLAVIMFPEAVFKMRNELNGGAPGETGRYYVVKLTIHLATNTAVANITVGATNFTTIPSVDTIDKLVVPSASVNPHHIVLTAPETGAPALVAARQGDDIWWGFSFSWPVDSHYFGVISGGYQGDWYATNNVDVVFGGYFHLEEADYGEIIEGGTDWVSGNNTNLVNGGTWS
jgi:hypothetical protein